SWKKITQTEDIVELELDLTLSDFMRSAEAVDILRNNREILRKTIFDLIVTQIVPKIIADTGQPSTVPDELNTDSVINSENKWSLSESPTEDIISSNRMKIQISLSSDRSVNPITALNTARGNLAANITDGIVNNLAYRYLGEDSSEVESEFSEETAPTTLH
ncbi:hypothetical protein KKA95_02380, partial [Patescibacteria group bacterium]|nr:hypothetical protein [Patescibacteria group bacterium]